VTEAPPRRRQRDDQAHRNAVSDTVKDTTLFLVDLLGVRLVAHIAGVEDSTVRRWAEGKSTPREAYERRLLATSQIAHILLEGGDASHTVRAWFIGMNPQLGDKAPADVIRADRSREALTAARAFIGTA
jgi:hypothetical protein